MQQPEIDYNVISHVIGILTVMHAADADKIISLLANYLWSEEETLLIRESCRKHNIVYDNE